MSELEFGKGGIKDAPDIRDFQFTDIAGASLSFDWDKGYDVEVEIGKKIEVKDQNGSSSCGGQAWGYYGEVLDPDTDHSPKSAKFIYAQTHVPGGGSGGRANCDLVISKGWAPENLCPSYENKLPPGEPFMQRKQDILQQAYTEALKDKALAYANVVQNIDLVAQAIRENKGCVIGITGKNNGTWSSKFPKRPDVLNNSCWNHWVYCGKAKLIDGKKYIGFLNSWGDKVGDKGWQWISEDYLATPFVWSVWTLVYNFPKPPQYHFTQQMKKGSKGNEVMELQRRLNVLPFDGIFGIITFNAVVKFQLERHLVGDGIVGPKTLAELNK